MTEPTPNTAASLPDDIAPDDPLIELPACDSAAVELLAEQLGLHSFAAQTLVRRGLGDLAAARTFLAPGELLDPSLLPGADAVAAAIARHLEAGSRIAVHGDYDVDGVCSTAILVRVLARLDANVTWHVPSRFEDGYGLSVPAIDRLAADGVDLIVTVDCGIGSVKEVEYARSIGVDMAICDHHTIGAELPDAPVVHPAMGEYPHPNLCAAATTFKLAQVLLGQVGRDPSEIDDELELVALATVCDVVPLQGENRALVQRGLVALRQTLRPGLRALIRVAGADQLKLDSGSLGYALGPRINAAGRMFSAEPAVELMLTTNEQRADELAHDLNGANARRREIEQTIQQEAETQARQQRDRFAIVVAKEGWHPGVLGIIAGRIAERFHRPCVALAIENGVAAGSGRSGGVYDLHAGLADCSDLLRRFGGHKAAAGVELDESKLGRFRERLQQHAAGALSHDDLRPRVRVDAVGEPAQLTLDAVDALSALGPFGAANPDPQVLLPAVRVADLRKMGDSGQHFRLSVAGRGGRAGVVAFSWPTAVASGDAAPLVNIAVKLSRNEFRGNVEPQAKLVALSEVPGTDPVDWELEFIRELTIDPGTLSAPEALELDTAIDRRGDSPLAVIVELAGATDDAVVVVNDPVEWRPVMRALAQIVPSLAGLQVFGYGDERLAAGSWQRAVLAEPPPVPALAGVKAAHVVVAWNAPTVRVIAGRGADLLLDRPHVVGVFRAVKDSGDPGWETLGPALQAVTPSARIAAQAVRTLRELSLVRVIGDGQAVEAIEVASAAKTELDLSETFRSYSAYREESTTWLRQIAQEPTPGAP
ncbi:MAG: single-stranded-DNA-specific exonuclease RecJ [Solirubrobacterales bacterium]